MGGKLIVPNIKTQTFSFAEKQRNRLSSVKVGRWGQRRWRWTAETKRFQPTSHIQHKGQGCFLQCRRGRVVLLTTDWFQLRLASHTSGKTQSYTSIVATFYFYNLVFWGWEVARKAEELEPAAALRAWRLHPRAGWWVITRVMRQQRLIDLFTGSQSTVPLIYKSKCGQSSLMDKQQKDVFLILLWPTSCFPFVPIHIHYPSFPVGVQTPWVSPLMGVHPSLRVTSIWGGKAKENSNDAALLKTPRI